MERRENDTADTDFVISAANYLEVSEFAIFRDAFADWYGKDASEKQMEKVFVQYLQEDKVPFWVRNYARKRVEDSGLAGQEREDSRLAHNFLYLASIIAEYVLLACYLVIR